MTGRSLQNTVSSTDRSALPGMTKLVILSMVWMAAASPLWSQQNRCLPGDIEKYAAKATSRSDVNLDRNKLGFAGNFLDDKDSD